MHEVLEENTSPQTFSEKYIGLKLPAIIGIALLVIIAGVYIGVLLFGDNSLDAYMQLQAYEENLEEKVTSLKNENAQMQKEYFDLKKITSQE